MSDKQLITDKKILRQALKALLLGLFVIMSSQVPVSAQENDGTDKLIQQARYWEDRGRFDLANESWLKLLRVQPDHPEALAALGMNEARAGRTVPAQVYLQRLREAHPGHANIGLLEGAISAGGLDQEKLNEARAQAQAGNYDRAVRIYKDAFGENPPAGRLGLEYYQTLGGAKGGWEPAKQGLQDLAAKHPNNPEFQLAYAQHLTYREETRREGIRLLTGLSSNPNVAKKATEARRDALIWLNAGSKDVPLYDTYLKGNPDDRRVKEKLARVKRDNAAPAISRPAVPAPQKTDPLAGLNKNAFEALNNGRLAEAEQGFEQVLKRNPNDADALGGLGIVRLRQERFANAVNLLEQSSRVQPNRAKRWREALGTARYWVLVRRGQAARKDNNLMEAEKWFRQAIPMNPNEITPRVELADILMESDRPEEAEREYRQVLKRDPDNGAALRGIVTILQKRGLKDQALSFAERLPPEQQKKIYALNTLKAEVLRDRAQKAEAANQLAVAEQYLREALFLDPSSPWTRLQLASVYRGQGRLREAKTLIESLLEGTDDIPDAYFIRALIAEEEQDWWGGLQALERIQPGSRTPAMADLQRRMWVRYQATRAGALARMGRTAEARQILDQISPALAESPDMMGSIAQAYADVGDEVTALSLMRKALTTSDPDPGLRMMYASLLFKLRQDAEFDVQLQNLIGDPRLTPQQRVDLARLQVAHGLRQADQTREDGDLATAYEYLAPLLRVNPNDPRLLSALARLYNDADEKAKALGIYEKVVQVDPENIDAYKGGIGAALELGETARAEALLNAAMQIDPGNPRLYALAGQLARQQGNNARALEYYRQALRLDGERNADELGGPSWRNAPTLHLLEPGSVQQAPRHPQYEQYGYDPGYSSNPFGTPRPTSSGWQQGSQEPVPSWHNGWSMQPVASYGVQGNQPQYSPPTGMDRTAAPGERLTDEQIRAIADSAARVRPRTVGYSPDRHKPDYQMSAQESARDTGVFFARDNETAAEAFQISGHGYRDANLAPRVAQGVAEGELIRTAHGGYPDMHSQEQFAPPQSYSQPGYSQHPVRSGPVAGPVTQPYSAPAPPPVRLAAPVNQQGYYDPSGGYQYRPSTPQYSPPQTSSSTYSGYSAPSGEYPVYQSAPPASYSSYKNPPPVNYSAYKNPPPVSYSSYKNPPAADYSSYKNPPPPQQYPVYQPPVAAAPPQYPVYQRPAPQPRPVAPPPVSRPRPRPPYPAYRDPVLTPAPTGRVATRRARDPRDDILDEIIDIRAERSAYAAAGMSFRNRDGQEGLSQLFDAEGIIEGGIPFGPGQLSLRAIPTFIDAGTVSGEEAEVFGTVPLAEALIPGTADTISEEQQDSGIALGAVYEAGPFQVDVGATPIGFEVDNAVGGVVWNPKGKRWNVRLEAARRAVTDSVLSWAGTVDPVTGRTWGGVTKNGIRGDVSFDAGRSSGIYANAGFHALEGENVESNSMAELGGGVYTRVLQRPNDQVTAGLNLTTFFYDKNLRQFTFGHGGYFSPQSYFSIGVPVELIGRRGATSYRVGGSLGWQTFNEDDAPFFPNDSDLQTAIAALPVTSQHEGQTSSGILLTGKADVEHLVTPNVAVGGTIRGDNATDFTEFSALGYLKYYFRPQVSPKIPPKPLQPEWTQFRRF